METGEAASQSGSSPENPRLPETTASVESPGSVSGSKRSTAASAKNQRACDGCRARKVRCLYGSGEQRCQGCIFLDIACTHLRPRRRRGPQNKYFTASLFVISVIFIVG
ncbi:Transcriptional regulatory protein EDS1 like [Verticillium longisporum]|uniref:Transcriptional regulatory protein EDS1 like n=1 Tax=Verticillium longisporum TaxID=100787 RepID=A0A8I3AW58_VERLO|nr:Transcriptional regulatory protein EDS1 like [Verticillium longisporum]KAG7141338.1 Transcriptional regulatory protein EDS1 like [Verticillium longisporum]